MWAAGGRGRNPGPRWGAGRGGEVRHCEWSLFSIRVYLPEADMQGMAGQGWARRGQAGQGEAGQGKANFLEDPGSRK